MPPTVVVCVPVSQRTPRRPCRAAYQQQLHQLRARIKSSSSQPDGALSRLEVPSALLR